MATRRTNRGQVIDMDALVSGSNPRSSAIGNMGINAKGDKLGPGGTIKQKSEDRVREYYQNNPRSSTSKQSLKGKMPSQENTVSKQDAPKTAKTAQENTRVTRAQVEERKEQIKREIKPDPIVEPDEFDAPGGVEPLGYKEVELPNGDIEMVPYYREEDK